MFGFRLIFALTVPMALFSCAAQPALANGKPLDHYPVADHMPAMIATSFDLARQSVKGRPGVLVDWNGADDATRIAAPVVAPQANKTGTDPVNLLPPERPARRIPRSEWVYQTLNVIDGLQTIRCLDTGRCHEANPLLGKNPSPGKLIGVKAASGIVHYLITRELVRRGGPVNTWEFITIAVQGGVVALNMRFVL